MDSPFVDYKATELSIDKIISYFVEPKHIYRLYTNKAAFITGQRGTGKTTILKYLANKYNEFDGDAKKDRLGVYYRFEINRMSSFSGDFLTDKQWEDLFAHTLSVIICSELTSILITQKEYYQFEKERIICQQVLRHFFKDEPPDMTTFEALLDFLKRQESLAAFYKRNPQKSEMPIVCDYGVVFEDYCKLISEEEAFKNVCIHFMFDESENLLNYQQRIINTFVKNSSHYHTYKICVRPKGIKTYSTLSSEYIRGTDDFQELDFNDDIIGNNNDTRVFMKKMCAKRLYEYYNENKIEYKDSDLDIEQYLDVIRDNQIFDNISKKANYMIQLHNDVKLLLQSHSLESIEESIQKFDLFDLRLFLVLSNKKGFDLKQAFHSIQTKDKKYLNWLHNYERAVLFLCCHESQTAYSYGGLDNIITISGKVVRYVLEICDTIFQFMSKNNRIFDRIDVETQTKAIKKVSELRFQQIITIPNVGYEIKQLILTCGKIFSMYHNDKRLAKFEPNHFSLYQRSNQFSHNDFEKVKLALIVSIKWGIFLVDKTTKEKHKYESTDEDTDYFIHPIFTPYFQISTRKKQKCIFPYEEIYHFLYGNTKKVNDILNDYHDNLNTKENDNNQITLFEVNNDSFQ